MKNFICLGSKFASMAEKTKAGACNFSENIHDIAAAFGQESCLSHHQKIYHALKTAFLVTTLSMSCLTFNVSAAAATAFACGDELLALESIGEKARTKSGSDPPQPDPK